MESLININLTDNDRDMIITGEKYIRAGEIQPNGIIAAYSNMWYKFTCNKCKWDEGWMNRGKLISRKDRCPCCNGQRLVVGVNDFNTVYPELAVLLKDKSDGIVRKSSANKTIAVCPECGYEKHVTLVNLTKHGFVCDYCDGGDSYPNRLMKNILEMLNIEFLKEYSPEWIKPKRYDFYIPSLSLIIEMDGLQHYKDSNFNGTRTSCKTISKNDRFKEEAAKKNGIKVIRIRSFSSEYEQTKNDIINNLNEYLDLDSVDWIKCEEKSRENIIKNICQYKKENTELLSGDLSKIFNIGQSTITRYLKIGAKIGWCEYDPLVESDKNIKNSIRRTKNTAKKIVVMNKNTDEVLGAFDSALKLEETSVDIFGVIFKRHNVRYCCNNKSKRCYGYKVRYYEDIFDTVATTE